VPIRQHNDDKIIFSITLSVNIDQTLVFIFVIEKKKLLTKSYIAFSILFLNIYN